MKSDTTTARKQEQFGYAYDKGWNLNRRTNNALVQTFTTDNLNQLTNVTRANSYTVAGSVSTTPTSVTVKDNANSAVAATVYGDNTFARDGVTLLNGNNTFTAVAENAAGLKDTNVVNAYLPTPVTLYYDARGNLTNDGRRVFFYDDENQLTTVVVSNAWLSQFTYDGMMRRRIRKEYTWSGTWLQTNEVRYVYDGRVVVQERNASVALVSYTRGNDLSGSLQGAGGIGGLLARTVMPSTITSQPSSAYYHADGNGNITALVNTNQIVVARYNYDPFGNLLASRGPLAEANLYRFSSKEYHANSGLVYYLYRFYDANLQRWVNRDPLGDGSSLSVVSFPITLGVESRNNEEMTSEDFLTAWSRINLSLYISLGNNPVNLIDAHGLDPGQRFPDVDSAGKDGACYIKANKLIFDGDHQEQASVIFKDANGKFYYNVPRHGDGPAGTSKADWEGKLDPKDAIAGHIHDHIKGEEFSNVKDTPQGKPKDVEMLKKESIPGYLLTPKGEIKKYDPSSDKTTTLGNATDCKK